jgi:hypothetical protein
MYIVLVFVNQYSMTCFDMIWIADNIGHRCIIICKPTSKTNAACKGAVNHFLRLDNCFRLEFARCFAQGTVRGLLSEWVVKMTNYCTPIISSGVRKMEHHGKVFSNQWPENSPFHLLCGGVRCAVVCTHHHCWYWSSTSTLVDRRRMMSGRQMCHPFTQFPAIVTFKFRILPTANASEIFCREKTSLLHQKLTKSRGSRIGRSLNEGDEFAFKLAEAELVTVSWVLFSSN